MNDVLNDEGSTTETTSAEPADSQPAGGPTNWVSSLPEDMRGLAENKGWKEPADALRSYQHLESVFGADKAGRALLAPKSAEDTEGFEKIYKALGRPDDVDGYELKGLFEGDEVDDVFLGAMAKNMHEAGLSKTQVHKMATAYQGMYKAAMAEAEARLNTEIDELKASIPAEIQEMARRGFRLFGLPKEEGDAVSDAIVQALGPRQAVTLFAKIGQAVGADRPVNGAEPPFRGAANSRIDQLLADPIFSKRYLEGDQSAIDEISELTRRATAR